MRRRINERACYGSGANAALDLTNVATWVSIRGNLNTQPNLGPGKHVKPLLSSSSVRIQR